MITELLNKGHVSKALAELRKRSASYPGEGFGDRLDALQTEFKYMSDFMLQGYKDEKRASLFQELLQRIADLDYDLQVRETLCENPYLQGIFKKLHAADRSAESLQDMILAPLTPQEHYKNLSTCFLSLLTSGHWRQKQADEWSAFISSPKTNPIDAATLTAAVMLSAIYHYSYYKALCLANIYVLCEREEVRQRAFVGCLLAVSEADEPQDGRFSTLLNILLADEEDRKSLIETQVQMAACANAEADSTEINRNIMPGLLRNQPFRFTKDGIVEKEEENDCINLDADERRMEAVAEGVNKMIQMQKNGSDVFFGGFRQMKRFPFFYQIANWLMPFDINHPDIGREVKSLQGSEFVGKVTERGPFCNSDKYSFVIAMAGVMGQLPEDMRKMMEEGEVGPLGMQDTSYATPSPSLLRLQYLQDLYRFFRLSPLGSSLRNPFVHVPQYRLWTVTGDSLSDADRKTIFNLMLRDAGLWDSKAGSGGEPSTASPAAFHPADLILSGFEDKEGFDYLSCHAGCMMRRKRYKEAIDAYSRCLLSKPEDPVLMRGMARACYGGGEYAKAAFYFDALHTLFPKRISYVLNYAMAMVMDGAADSVVNEMYKLEYENPDNTMVKNTLGWVLLHARKAEQALSVYEKLTDSKTANGDFAVTLNAFYACLANGKAEQGVEMLRQYCDGLDAGQRKAFPDLLADAMEEDTHLLEIYGVCRAEKGIILSQFDY